MKISVLKNPAGQTDLEDWGVAPGRIQGSLQTSGKVLHAGPEAPSGCGIWACGPGQFDCHLTKDEFFYFLSGRCTYALENGDVVEISAETAAFFPEGWKGICTIHEEIKTLYIIR